MRAREEEERHLAADNAVVEVQLVVVAEQGGEDVAGDLDVLARGLPGEQQPPALATDGARNSASQSSSACAIATRWASLSPVECARVAPWMNLAL